MVEEMNTILGDQTWWNAAKRAEAELRFAKQIIEAFYDEIQAGRDDPESLRESHIRLPNKDDGYSRVLFVGTTGAGKTSLLRQLIGSDPEEDRFPATGSAKTTIADIEVIQAEGEFEAAVTFFTEFQTQANIEECVTAAALAAYENAPIDKIANCFLNHRDQKFRLSYLLGSWRKAAASDEQDEFSFDTEEEPRVFDDEAALSEEQRAAHRQMLEQYLARIGKLSASVVSELTAELGVDAKAGSADREAAQQLIEENFEAQLSQLEAFHELVQDILEDVRSRFDLIEAGELLRRRSGWPELWLFTTEDRAEFIRHIRWFSSISWRQFGRLLTPLVEGIRVRGPLFPEFAEGPAKVAFIDGQGLGHKPDSSPSVSVTTRVTKRFGQVDVILLVDNAQQPMQAAPLSVLRAVASSGHQGKLAIAFTHFDQITGENLPGASEKRAHVMASVLNALSSLRDVLGASVVKTIEQGLDSRCFMLGGVDRQLTKIRGRAGDYMKEQLTNLMGFFEAAIAPPPTAEAGPIYDPTGIGFAVQEAVAKFQGPWLARLGMGTYEGFSKEHWGRVRALNRRIADERDDYEYDTLRPVADLVTQLRESISRFLNTPINWTKPPQDEQEEQSAIAHIRRAVDIAIHELAVKRLVADHLDEWRDGYKLRGTDSTTRRAATIRRIYDAAAPLPDTIMTSPSTAFLHEIRRIVILAIRENGGEVQLSESA